MLAQGIRHLSPPRGSCGVLLFWTHGSVEHASHEHNDDSPIIIKKVTAQHTDKTCLVYVYYFVNVEYRPETTLRVIPSEGVMDAEDRETAPLSPSSGAASPMSIASPTSPESTAAMDLEKRARA